MAKRTENEDDAFELKTDCFILINRKTNKIWHESFSSREAAQGKIDLEKQRGINVEGWEIEKR